MLATAGKRQRRAVARARVHDPRAEVHYQHGLKRAKDARWSEAAAAFELAVKRAPDDAVFWLNLAHARVKLGELELAVLAARRALAIDPHSELAVTIATQCLAAANRHEEMIELLQALDLEQVSDASAHFALGQACLALNRYQDSVSAFLAALQRKPDFMLAHLHLGNVFERMKMHEEARECFKTAIAVGGNRAQLLSAMAYQALHACRWDLFDQDWSDLQNALREGTGQAAPFQLLTMVSTRDQQLAASQARWQECCGAIAPLPITGAREQRPRIRLGYATNDLFRHATAYLIAEVLERHDRERFDVFMYSYGHDDGSEIRQRIVLATGPNFVDAREISDRALAERIRNDDIDILVDLKGYTLGSRFGVFAYHPARIQVNYLGYPGTLGAPCYEYIIGDQIVAPLEHADGYSEKIAHLPHCYQPNDRKRPIGPRPTRAQCALPEEGFVFCSFNSCYKITPTVFDRWCRLLHRVDGSVLWLYEANDQAKRNLVLQAQRRGIASQRLVWAPHVPLEAHLARLQLADLALDTLPVNAHTTASDALWAGVPMVTTAGESFASRVASSVLHAAELPDLVACDADAYERIALDLALQPARLWEIRQRVAANRDRCALFDSQSYTRELEALYERMLAAWTRGAPPDHLPALS
ncbi:MAG TPA: tetratricopeptide repeat protein [Burkholderiaceae bacterium]|nr:tetratricopeptide repeat protein [Burkholderiaceae bacterium]